MARAVCEMIRAPSSSAAPTRWGRWATAATDWRAAASICGLRPAGVQPSTVVVHVVADEESLTDDTPVQLDGESAPGPTAAELRQMTIREALSPARRT